MKHVPFVLIFKKDIELIFLLITCIYMYTKKGDWCNLEFVLGHGLTTCLHKLVIFLVPMGGTIFFHYIII